MAVPSTSKDNDWPEQDCIRFSLQQVVPELSVTPVDPLPAKKSTDAQIQKKQLSLYKDFLYHENVYAYDAMVTGWILYPPCNFSIEEIESNSYSVVGPQLDDDSEIIEIVDVDGESMLSVNPLWTVEFPEGYHGLITHPTTHAADLKSNAVVPQVVPQQSTTSDLEILLNIDGEFTMTTQDPLAQLIPIDDHDPPASYRTANPTEMDAIKKEERRKNLYPDEYGQRREEKRWGKILDVHD